MQISTREFKRVTVVDVDGRVDHHTAPELEATLEDLISNGTHNIVVDMSGVEYISSRGLRALLAARKQVQRWGRGDVRLARLRPNVKDTLNLVGFTQLFQIYDDVTEAVGSY